MIFVEDEIYVYVEDELILNNVKQEIEQGLAITKILTHEQFEANAYKVKGEW